MRNFTKYLPLFLITLLLASILVSCSVEQKLAQNFIKTQPNITLQVFTPDLLYKFNHKGEEISGFDTLNDAQQDSSLFVNSRFMQYVNDSIYLENYINNFLDELRALGFTVYLDHSVDSFLSGLISIGT